jgi:hypothetical protein
MADSVHATDVEPDVAGPYHATAQQNHSFMDLTGPTLPTVIDTIK